MSKPLKTQIAFARALIESETIRELEALRTAYRISLLIREQQVLDLLSKEIETRLQREAELK